MSTRAKTSYSIVDTAFDAYDWGTPTLPKHVPRRDKTMSGEETLWLAMLNIAWADAVAVPKELVCGPEAKAKVDHIGRYLKAREKTKVMSHLRLYPEDAKTDPYYRECHALYGQPTNGDYEKACKEVKRIGRPRYTDEQIERLRAWLWITEQHPRFKTACHLTGSDPDVMSDAVYRAVTGRKRGRPKLVHAAPIA